jgi:glycine betaine/choline ABC-type transport system substrate-binding protein
MKKLIMVLLAISLITLAGCTSTSDNEKEEYSGKIVIAGKPMTEQYILVEILTQLIEAETTLEVEQQQGIGGGTSNIHPAMISGEVDIYPEYTGTGWLFVLKEDLINDPEALYQAVKSDYQSKYNISWSGLYGFNDTYAIAIKKDVAEMYDIKTYSDLAKNSDMLRFGAEYDFYEREDGYPGLVDIYGFDFNEKIELDIGLKYQAISSDQVDVINVFSTDAKLKEYELLVLEDDKNFFPSYFAATLIRNETLEMYPELNDVLEMLTGMISNDEMTEMNYMVEIEKMDPKDVATDFLNEKELLK